MFTGIIEHVGTIIQCRTVPGGRRLRVDLGPLASGARPGDSISISGVCLTIANLTPPLADFDVIQETLDATTIRGWTVGDPVNLERALGVNGRIDGHFVQGHVDGIATVVAVEASNVESVIRLCPEPHLRSFLIPKGSVALEGVSLTIASIRREEFSVALIPTTLARTTLSRLTPGARVNVETDVLVRTIVHRLSSLERPGGLTLESLQSAGFA